MADHPTVDSPTEPKASGIWLRVVLSLRRLTVRLCVSTMAAVITVPTVISALAIDPAVPSTAHRACRKQREPSGRGSVVVGPWPIHGGRPALTVPVVSEAEADSDEARALQPPSDSDEARALQPPSDSDEARALQPPSDSDEAHEMQTLATLFNVHTGEVLALSENEPPNERFSEALADRVTGSQITLDPRLLDLLRRIAKRNPGARLELISGYRSPKLNEMLRKKGHNVASHSQHSLGHACDFRVIGLTPAQMKKEVLALGWQGGIGRYDKQSDWFVHADVGKKRQWYEGK